MNAVPLYPYDSRARESEIFFQAAHGTLYRGDSLALLKSLPDESVQCCITSPPYWGLRDYGAEGQIGLEDTPGEHIARLTAVFREVRRALKKDGTLWVNYGDTYAGSISGGLEGSTLQGGLRNQNISNRHLKGKSFLPAKNLMGLPWRLAFALQDDGWYLRCDIIWHKPNPMPESVKDRPTRAHEYLFLFSKSERYQYDHEAVREPAAAMCEHDHTGQGGACHVPGQPSHTGNRSRKQNARALGFVRNGQEPDRPGQKYGQHRPERTPRPGIDTRGGNQGTGGIPVIGKGNAKTFRGGGAYTSGQSFDNSAAAERDSHGNAPNPTYTRNRRSVWTIPTHPCPDAHFATFPPALVKPCIMAGSQPGDVVFDPFMGSGTTAMVARQLGRRWLGIELNPEYCALALKRIGANRLMLMEL